MKRPVDPHFRFVVGWAEISHFPGTIALLAFWGLCLVSPASAGGKETGDARRGREIYVNGLGAEGAEIKCTTGASGIETSAAVLKCVNCHGADGRGRPEGGVFPSGIRWSELSKPYPVPLPSGRKRPPYTAASLERAVVHGIDPAGASLGAVMPRYRLSPTEAADLVAYLKELDAAAEPGVLADRITLGVMLPPERAGGSAGLAIRETLVAVFQEINKAGGIYGRRIECSFATAPEKELVHAWESFFAREKPFAMLGGYMEGAETEISKLIEREHVPLIQSFSPSGRQPTATNRYLFHLVADWETQCVALACFAAENGLLAGPPSLILSDDAELAGPFVERLTSLAKAGDWPAPRVIGIKPATDWAALLRSSQDAAMFWLGDAEPLEKLFKAAEQVGIYPTLLAPGSVAASRMMHAPAGFAGRLHLAIPAVPGDAEPESRAEFFRLARSANFTESDLNTRLLALSAAKTLVHLLREGEHEITRENLVTLAEQLYDFHPGYTRAITFTRTRRMGVGGAHVAGVDLAKAGLVLPTRWIESSLPGSGELPLLFEDAAKQSGGPTLPRAR